MDQGIYIAASGAIAMEQRLEIIANNLANVNTTGFKKDSISFEDFQKSLDTSRLCPGQYRSTPVDVVIGKQYIDTTQGGFRNTGNPLDVTIAGEGFFVVNTPDGTRYTRAGSFTLSPEGLLVTPQGYAVQGEGGDITIDQGAVIIDSDGTISVDGNVVDKLQIRSIEEDALVRQGNATFSVRQGYAPGTVESPDIRQMCLEASNVDPIGEMVDLISTQRAYESYQKIMKAFTDTYAQSMHNVGTVA
ncbi:MAG TPA: flagellar basal-body rod protein FlgF [Deltaproteobacteria bacterium]|jgi:flagellar basal-body rod protein FlgG|nr:flagellar basal-body rod protein FlgF [Deltaproteobacteria bacterium]